MTASTKPTLLCFHGGGTNTTIFRVQLARINRLLSPYYNFLFVNGPIPASAGPGVLPVFEGCGPYLRWVVPRNPPTGITTGAARAAEEALIDEAIAAALQHQPLSPGSEIVGVVGFSAGAALATEFLLRRQRGDYVSTGSQAADVAWKNLRFGVLLNGVLPPWSNGSGERVTLPTVHLHGLEDPWLEASRVLLSDCFEHEAARLMEFNGGHHLPRTPEENEKLKTLILEAAMRGGS